MEGIKQLLRFIAKYKGAVLLAAVIGSCTVLCSVGLLGASAVLISKAAIVPAMLELMTSVALVRFFGLFRAVFRYTERLVSHDVTLKVLADLRSWYYEKLIPLLPGAVGNKGAKLFKNIISDVELLQFFYLRVVAAPLICLFVLIIMGGILYILVPEVAVLLLLAFLLEGIVFPLLFGTWQKRSAQLEQQAQERFHQRSNDFLLGFDAVWFGAKNKIQDVKTARKAMYQAQRKMRNLDQLLQLCNGLVGVVVLVGSFYVSAQAVNQGALQGIYLVMVPLMAWSALEAVQPMPLAVRYLFESSIAMDDMLQVIHTPVRGRETYTTTPTWSNEGVSFEDVTFAYQNTPVVKNISFSVAQGEHVAIVGGIGSGKSTVLNLLLGYYKQDSGKICLDGVELENTTVEQLGAHIAVVRQDCAIFSGSIAENLSYVADASEEQMWNALQKAGLYEFVQQLPGKLNYMLLESGSNLSGGQKKRLAIAQLFLQDKPVVLLDEVLEGLDDKNVDVILQRILDYCQGRTMLYITHDISVLNQFERIIEFQDGKLVYDGAQQNFSL